MTDNAFHPVRHRRTFEEILDQFEQAITSGNLSPGDRLPSERELASRLGVSRTSVREALRVLEALRIVEVKSGAENGVTLLRQPGNALPYLIKLYLSLGHVSVQSVIDFLIVISCWAVGQAARGEGGNEVVRELDRIVAAMKATEHDQFAFHELDAEFHTVAVRSLGNELADLLFEGCRETLRRLILAGISDTPDAWVAIHERLVHEHCQIVQAVNDGDPATAESLMREHVTVWSARAVAAAAAQGLTLR